MDEKQIAIEIKNIVKELNENCKQAHDMNLRVVLNQQELLTPTSEFPRIFIKSFIFKEL